MNNKIIVFLVIGTSVLSFQSNADEVDRSTVEAKNAAHALATCVIKNIREIEPNKGSGALFKSEAKLVKMHELKGIDKLDVNEVFVFQFRGGIKQRPMLPQIEAGKTYKLYLRRIMQDGHPTLYLEFDEDVIPMN